MLRSEALEEDRHHGCSRPGLGRDSGVFSAAWWENGDRKSHLRGTTRIFIGSSRPPLRFPLAGSPRADLIRYDNNRAQPWAGTSLKARPDGSASRLKGCFRSEGTRTTWWSWEVWNKETRHKFDPLNHLCKHMHKVPAGPFKSPARVEARRLTTPIWRRA